MFINERRIGVNTHRYICFLFFRIMHIQRGDIHIHTHAHKRKKGSNNDEKKKKYTIKFYLFVIH
jgi:hypothetical protein